LIPVVYYVSDSLRAFGGADVVKAPQVFQKGVRQNDVHMDIVMPLSQQSVKTTHILFDDILAIVRGAGNAIGALSIYRHFDCVRDENHSASLEFLFLLPHV
jgi:hypothetical protein